MSDAYNFLTSSAAQYETTSLWSKRMFLDNKTRDKLDTRLVVLV